MGHRKKTGFCWKDFFPCEDYLRRMSVSSDKRSGKQARNLSFNIISVTWCRVDKYPDGQICTTCKALNLSVSCPLKSTGRPVGEYLFTEMFLIGSPFATHTSGGLVMCRTVTEIAYSSQLITVRASHKLIAQEYVEGMSLGNTAVKTGVINRQTAYQTKESNSILVSANWRVCDCAFVAGTWPERIGTVRDPVSDNWPGIVRGGLMSLTRLVLDTSSRNSDIPYTNPIISMGMYAPRTFHPMV